MENVFEKLVFISKLIELNENLVKYGSAVNKINLDNNVNDISMRKLKIKLIRDNSDENEDKKRQCYQQLKCFWPKCRYSCKISKDLNQHISYHLNKTQFVCEECNKQFHQKFKTSFT